MNLAIGLRDFQTSDYEAIQKLWVETGVGGAHRGDTLTVIENSISRQGRLLVLEENPGGNPVGTCWLTYDGRRLYLHHMAIRPDLQRQGLGKQLMEESVQFAKKLNAQLKLEVDETNEPALSLYRKSGFQPLLGHFVYLRRDTQS